jgi:ATP-dependent helicase/nuclease subunit B
MKGVFGLPPGMNFPRMFVQGLLARMPSDDPTILARTTVYLNTRRMARAVEQELARSGARLLPRLHLVSNLAPLRLFADVPPPVSPLRRRLELTPLITKLMEREKGFASETAVFDLADSLASLMDEMHGEGVSPRALNSIDVADHSAHWQRSQTFLSIIAQYFAADAQPDAQAFQRLLAEQMIAQWQADPPQNPVIVAGSTGSRGTTRMIMQAVARLPQGVLVLPGFDFDTPDDVWQAMADARVGEDHPQYRYCKLMEVTGIGSVVPWVDAPAPVPSRNKLISLSLRPAPVTDRWMAEGPLLPDLTGATAGMTLIEAPTPRVEAVSIALMLRHALENGKSVALMTPDRNLTRLVTATLDAWGLRPDDSAGEPLALAPTGRFLRIVGKLFGQRITGETLLTLLKHPSTARGGDRGAHLRHVWQFERFIREKGVAFPDAACLRTWALGFADAEISGWATWLAGLLDGLEHVGKDPLTVHLNRHFDLCEAFAKGHDGATTGTLWTFEDGAAGLAALAGLMADADAAGEVGPAQFNDILTKMLQQHEVRRQGQFHPDLMIWGTREARIQGADLVILGGLNDGVWPSVPPPDPWLNRNMRLQAGLLLPERRIGLAAHDYQQAVCAAEVVLTRAKRDQQAETVASRWLNRLTNLLNGLPDQGGKLALLEMEKRGQRWLRLAAAFDRPERTIDPAVRPAPRPPVEHRPKQLSVTAIRTLMRDPYAIYASRILRLRPLPTLRPGPDPLLRGKVLHRILEIYLRNRTGGHDPRERLMAAADAVLAEDVAWPTTRALWRARLERAVGVFLQDDAEHGGQPILLEEKKWLDLADIGFRLTAQPDRIDVLPDGRLRIIDYKTGSLPTEKQQKLYDVQLLLEAAMAVRGAFGENVPTDVASIAYVGLGSDPKVVATEITDDLLETIWQNLRRLIATYSNDGQGYASRRALVQERDIGEFDHLARFGEWAMIDVATPEIVGGPR